MNAKHELDSVPGVEVTRLLQRVDGTVLGAVRLTDDLPATYATIRRQGWDVARSADDAPEIADALRLDSVPADTLLVTRDSGDRVVENVR